MNHDYYSYDYQTTGGNDPATLAVMILSGIILFLGIYAIGAWILGRIFKKAGLKPWIAWVPFYSQWKYLELGGQHGWIVLIGLVPYVGSIIAGIFTIIANYHINKGFGKGTGMFLVSIFLTFIWEIIIAFDKSTWQGTPVLTTLSQPNASTPDDQSQTPPTSPTV